MKQTKKLCHCNPQIRNNYGCRPKGYATLRKVNDICIAPQHIPKTESCNPQFKN